MINKKKKINGSITKIREQNKKSLMELAKKLVKRINASGQRHGHIAEAVQATDETFSRFMALKPDYVTQRICTAVNEYLTKKGF
jgi:hypothetical protein